MYIGAAYSLKLSKKDAIAICYFGEGAASEGAYSYTLIIPLLHPYYILITPLLHPYYTLTPLLQSAISGRGQLVNVHIHVHVHMSMLNICMYVCLYVYIYMYIYIQIYIHTGDFHAALNMTLTLETLLYPYYYLNTPLLLPYYTLITPLLHTYLTLITPLLHPYYTLI
jgi:hypothetical protein